MKNIMLISTAIFSVISFAAFSQSDDGPVFRGTNIGPADQLSKEQHERIFKTADSASKALNLPKDSKKIVLFSLPVKLKNGVTDYGFYSITGHVDHDLNYPDQLLDYNCGNITYDVSSGYNHQGTDFYAWPFSWLRMQNDEIEIIAAAPGTIIYKSDGNFDQNCSFNSYDWNAVYIEHADGSYAWYGHMKKNSLTSKNVGETVAEGEFLGVMGSSGSSTGPHLHFEVYNSSSSLIDPFEGACNDFNASTWWQDQLPYMDAGINRFQTCNHMPVVPDCPGVEIPNESDYFFTGDSVYLFAWFRNLSPGDELEVTFFRPDNSVDYTDTWTSSWPFYQVAWLYYYILPGSGDPSGLWKAEAVYKGQTYIKQFYFNVSAGFEEASQQNISVTQDENNLYVSFRNPESVSGQIKWNIFDATGRVTGNGTQNVFSNNIIPLNSYSKGMYYLLLETNEGFYNKKICR